MDEFSDKYETDGGICIGMITSGGANHFTEENNRERQKNKIAKNITGKACSIS